MRKQDIHELVIAGRSVVHRGACCTVSRGALERALLDDARRARAQQPVDGTRIERLQAALADFYACGCHRTLD